LYFKELQQEDGNTQPNDNASDTGKENASQNQSSGDDNKNNNDTGPPEKKDHQKTTLSDGEVDPYTEFEDLIRTKSKAEIVKMPAHTRSTMLGRLGCQYLQAMDPVVLD
jgi:hypothetical protein